MEKMTATSVRACDAEKVDSSPGMVELSCPALSFMRGEPEEEEEATTKMKARLG